MHLIMKFKPILTELVPLAAIGFAWLAFKNMGKDPEEGGPVTRFMRRIDWDNWLITLVSALVLAAVITKSAL